jgi:hypothetical protein
VIATKTMSGSSAAQTRWPELFSATAQRGADFSVKFQDLVDRLFQDILDTLRHKD